MLPEKSVEKYKKTIRDNYPWVLTEEQLDNFVRDLIKFWEGMIEWYDNGHFKNN